MKHILNVGGVPDWAPVLVQLPGGAAGGVQQPLHELPPGGQLRAAPRHGHRGAVVPRRREECGAEAGHCGLPVAGHDPAAVEVVVAVLHQRLPRSLQLVPETSLKLSSSELRTVGTIYLKADSSLSKG